MGRVDPPVQDELLHRTPGDLAPDRVEAGDRHRFRRIVDDHVDAGGLLEGADVAAVAADDAALHLVRRQGYDRDRDFGHVVRRHPLDGVGDQLARPALAFGLSFLLDLPDDADHVAAGLALDLGQQQRLGIVPAHARDALQLFDGLLVQRLKLVFLPIEGALALVQLLVALLDLLHALVHFGPPALQPLLLTPELAAPARGLGFGLVPHPQGLVARAEFDLARLAPGRFQNAFGHYLTRQRGALLLHSSNGNPDPDADQQGDQPDSQSDSQGSAHGVSSLSPSAAACRRCSTWRMVS